MSTWSPHGLVLQMYNRFLRKQPVQSPQTPSEDLPVNVTLSPACTLLAWQRHAFGIHTWPLHYQNPSGGADFVL